jgi:hypothetical protein
VKQAVHRAQLPELSCRQSEIEQAWLSLFESHGFIAQSFVTFTFDPKRWQTISPYKAMGLFRWWLQEVNRQLGGRDYKRKCKHSLLSYAVGVDYHRSGDVHLHAVIDGWFDYSCARKVWGRRCGFMGIDQVTDPVGSLQHVLKYIRKADDFGPAVWFHRSPARRPASIPEKAPGLGAGKGPAGDLPG